MLYNKLSLRKKQHLGVQDQEVSRVCLVCAWGGLLNIGDTPLQNQMVERKSKLEAVKEDNICPKVKTSVSRFQYINFEGKNIWSSVISFSLPALLMWAF